LLRLREDYEAVAPHLLGEGGSAQKRGKDCSGEQGSFEGVHV